MPALITKEQMQGVCPSTYIICPDCDHVVLRKNATINVWPEQGKEEVLQCEYCELWIREFYSIPAKKN